MDAYSREIIQKRLAAVFGPQNVWELLAQYKVERHRPSDTAFQEVEVTVERNSQLGYRVLAVDTKRNIFDDADPKHDLGMALADVDWKIFDGPAWNDPSL